MNAIEKYETACKALDSGLMTLGDFEKEIAPLRDVAPVVHARWEKKKDSGLFYCSECGLHSMHKWPYCEQCGAKMDGNFQRKRRMKHEYR